LAQLLQQRFGQRGARYALGAHLDHERRGRAVGPARGLCGRTGDRGLLSAYRVDYQ
jgi:hypothetical protein